MSEARQTTVIEIAFSILTGEKINNDYEINYIVKRINKGLKRLGYEEIQSHTRCSDWK